MLITIMKLKQYFKVSFIIKHKQTYYTSTKYNIMSKAFSIIKD